VRAAGRRGGAPRGAGLALPAASGGVRAAPAPGGAGGSRLVGLVPEHVDRYWQLTLEFLAIARETWPAILAERNAIEPAARRDRLINLESARLAAARHGPGIAAGSTRAEPGPAQAPPAPPRLPPARGGPPAPCTAL